MSEHSSSNLNIKIDTFPGSLSLYLIKTLMKYICYAFFFLLICLLCRGVIHNPHDEGRKKSHLSTPTMPIFSSPKTSLLILPSHGVKQMLLQSMVAWKLRKQPNRKFSDLPPPFSPEDLQVTGGLPHTRKEVISHRDTRKNLNSTS